MEECGRSKFEKNMKKALVFRVEKDYDFYLWLVYGQKGICCTNF